MRNDGRPLRILMILESRFPTQHGGGAESQVCTLAKGLRSRGQRVTVLAPMVPHGPQRRVDRVEGIPVVRVPYPRIPVFRVAWLWLRLAGILYKRRDRYDVWHVHIAHYLGAIAALLGPIVQRPVVVKVSGWWELERGILAPHAWVAARIAKRCLMRVDAWQAISQRIASALLNAGVPSERIVALPNGVDLRRFKIAERTPAIGAPRFVFVGRLVPEKGLRTLLDAFSEVAAEMPNARLRIVGDGPLARNLARQSALLEIESQVEFTGHRDDVANLLGEADFGVLPSDIEGLSNTLLEGMACGLPMLASRISGNEDIIRDGVNGWLFEPGDSAGLAVAMRAAAALDAGELRAMSTRARQSVDEFAGLDSVLDALMRLYGDGMRACESAATANERGK